MHKPRKHIAECSVAELARERGEGRLGQDVGRRGAQLGAEIRALGPPRVDVGRRLSVDGDDAAAADLNSVD